MSSATVNARTVLCTRSPLVIADMSRPFAAKFAGKCPLLGRRYMAGTKVRRIVFRNEDNGAEFTGYIPADNTGVNTLNLMRWAGTSEDNLATTAFVRVNDGAEERALEALRLGYAVEVLTATGAAKLYRRTEHNGKIGRMTERAWASNFRRNAVAYAITGYADADKV